MRDCAALRQEKGWPRSRLAAELGVSETYAREVEAGMKKPPTSERIRRISALLGVDAGELLALAGRPFVPAMKGGKPEVDETMADVVKLYESGKMTVPIARSIRNAIDTYTAA